MGTVKISSTSSSFLSKARELMSSLIHPKTGKTLVPVIARMGGPFPKTSILSEFKHVPNSSSVSLKAAWMSVSPGSK